MSRSIALKKGLDITLLGEADKVYASLKNAEEYVIKPTDFHGLTPKLNVKIEDHVKAEDLLFFMISISIK